MRVRRLRPPGDDYYLVVLGQPGRTVGVAAVNAARGTVDDWARLPGSAEHMVIDEPGAVARAGLGTGARAEAVWEPSALSRSPLYPFWRVSAGDRTLYVDWQGSLWQTVEPAGYGGARSGSGGD